MKPLRTHPEVDVEIEEAADFYESARPGYGELIRAEIEVRFAGVSEHPSATPLYRNTGCRRAKLKSFPHYLYFLELDDVIWVVALEHPSREKGYWLHRLDDIRGTTDLN